MKKNRGKPPKFKNFKQLEEKIDQYFTNCPDKRTIFVHNKKTNEVIEYKFAAPTLSGLALFLGFCSRQSLYDYEQKQEYSYTIKKARLRIENEYEKQLFSDKCTGAIFALKNLGWSDKAQEENTLNIPIIVDDIE